MLVRPAIHSIPAHAPPATPVRVAVVGCGAISRDFHIPVLAGYAGVRLLALADRDIVRAAALARAYGVGTVTADATELDPRHVDAALVATPPFHHASCAIELMRRGIHVLVEKPMALTLADAQSMVATAREAGVVLSVGLFRRLYPSMRMLRSLIDSRMLGRPLSFDIEAGSVYGWPLTTLANMRKDQGGGGVFLDIAPHTLDQLLFALPGELELLNYQDNSLGGIESDCLVRFRVHHEGAPVEGRMELSRTRKLRNTIRIECERGVLELPSGERFRITIRPHGLELTDAVRDAVRPHLIQTGWADEHESLGYAAYREQIDDWIGAIRLGAVPQLSGESALPVVGFIEECYRTAGRLPEPWVEEGLRGLAPPPPPSPLHETPPPSPLPEAERGGKTEATPPPSPLPEAERGGNDLLLRSPIRGGVKSAPRRVLVTGATGFIGCRVAEILRLREGWDVRGLVRNPANASRLARLPVEMVLGDLHSPEQMARAVQDCDAVVHCAIGTAYGQRQEIFAVTVEGMRRLAEAARAAGVRRFVHVSTVAVHGKQVAGVLDEATPVLPTRGDDYAESKAEAERVIARALQAGLPAVVLRLANVYGPFASTLITRPLPLLAQGALAVLGGDVKPCNMVYVDNVAEAIVRALEAPAHDAVGQTFTISDGDEMTWLDFYGSFARALGVAPPAVSGVTATGAASSRNGPLRWLGSWLRGWKEVLTSAEAKGLARKYLQTDPVGTLPRTLLERSPRLERGLRRLLKMDRPLVYSPEMTVADTPPHRMVMNPIEAFVSPARARRLLGFTPAVPTSRAVELTLDWVRHARLVAGKEA